MQEHIISTYRTDANYSKKLETWVPQTEQVWIVPSYFQLLNINNSYVGNLVEILSEGVQFFGL
jgi:hypothetical protein